MDPHQAGRVTQKTRNVYFSAGRHFTSWYRRNGLVIRDAMECDDLLVEWKNAADGLRTVPTPSPQVFINAIAFCEFVMPQFKGELKWSHTVSNAWVKQTPIRH